MSGAATTAGPAPRRSLAARLRPLMPVIRPHRAPVIAAIVTGALHQLLVLGAAGAGAYVIAKAANGASATDLTPALIVLAALVIPQTLARMANVYYNHVAAYRALVDMRAQLYDAVERLSPGYVLNRRSGDLGAVVMSDVEKVERFFAHTLSQLVVAATVPTATTIALVWFHTALALALLPTLVLLATVPGWLRRRAEAQGREMREALAVMSAEAVDTVQGLRELVAFGAQDRRLTLLRAQGAVLREAKVADGRRSGWEHAATDTITLAGVLAVLVTGAGLVEAGSLDEVWFPVAVVLAAVSVLPILKVTEIARELHIVAAAAERIFAILDTPSAVTDLVDTAPPGPISPEIAFTGVSFRYGPALPTALDAVSFTIGDGETVALVGASGAGKSTCANLLLRMWDPETGAVTIGGHDLRAFPQEDLRRLLTLVPQDTHLFNISLRENIRLGRPEATDADVMGAARAALADEFISQLPDGYDTAAGELGVRMSGGQRQRIAIARALLKDAPILIMDEAVSNLDAASERALTLAMRHAAAGRTTLVIAHRLSTIRAADRIVLLDRGRVAEIGTHDELVARGGAYVELLATQLISAGGA